MPARFEAELLRVKAGLVRNWMARLALASMLAHAPVAHGQPGAQQPLQTIPATAQAAAVADTPKTPARMAYDALLNDERSDTIAVLLRDVVREAKLPCRYVTDYQVIRSGTGSRTVKLRCREQQLMMVTVRSSGLPSVAGGDGTIGPMLPRDGYIVSFTGQRIDQYYDDQADAPKEAARPAPAKVAAPAQESGGNFWVIAIILFNLLIFVILIVVLNRLFRPSKDVFETLSAQLANMRSADKDVLISQSREIYPNIYAHPDGYFIASGSRGKRRFFPTVTAAILYRDYGFKIREIKTS